MAWRAAGEPWAGLLGNPQGRGGSRGLREGAARGEAESWGVLAATGRADPSLRQRGGGSGTAGLLALGFPTANLGT